MLIWLIGSFLTLFLIRVVIPWLWGRRYMYKLSWQLDGPFAWPFIGNGISLINQEENLTTLDNFMRTYKSPARFWVGTRLFILLNNPDDIKTVLTSPHCLSKSDSYRFVKETFSGEGLLTSEVPVWKRHRKLIAPSFGLNAVNENIPIFNKHLKGLTEHLNNFVGKGVFNIKPIVTKFTMNMILETTLGTHVEHQNRERYIELLQFMGEIIGLRTFQPWLQIDSIFKRTKWYVYVKQFAALCDSIFDKLIKDTLTYGSDRLTLVDRFMQTVEENEDFTIDDVKGESNTVMMAGSDTSALAIATTILMLAIHPGYQEKLYEEVKQVFNTKDPEITKEDVNKLVYTEMCMRETMRIRPIVPLITRQNLQKIYLSNVEIPLHTELCINIHNVHVDKRWWGEDANEFRPDRFLPENIKNIHPFAFLGFSGGPRDCIGYKYATMVVKMTLAKIILNYRFTTKTKLEDVKISMAVNAKYLCDHMVEIHSRDQ